MKLKRPATSSDRGDDHLIPLINVVFLMLIFFMLAGQIRASDGRPFMPPAMESKQPEVSTRFVLLLTEDNRMFLNDEPVTEDQLMTVFKAQVARQAYEVSQSSLLIKIDQSLTAAQWRPVLAWASEAGLESVHLSTRRGVR
ncbi:biopolymer transporter ExbD [Marinobacter sp.]|uniref:ExbD/TolR family protein n=1 Tax=Marinobacter sp. TaxID=50741 RepID=UPI0019E50F3F|nr:biopolymer transporter ExbD [Marinobacter sp.]MBE0485622.1 biopolymer transporter ExbD [Marinobacter sp.]